MTHISTSPDEVLEVAKRIDGKIAVEYVSSRDAFKISQSLMYGGGDSTPVIYLKAGNYPDDFVSLRDEEEVRDWLYAAYLTPEGR